MSLFELAIDLKQWLDEWALMLSHDEIKEAIEELEDIDEGLKHD